MSRVELIVLRRSLIDRLTNLLPKCKLFSKSAIYPRRYYDDFVIEEKGYKNYLFDQILREDFSTVKKNKTEMKSLSTNLTDQ